MKERNKYFLYGGLSLLAIALILRGVNVDSLIWFPLFCLAIVLKVVFLINVFRRKGFRMTTWLLLILIGVVMIFTSLLFKYTFPIPWLRDALFYGAILLKVSGLVLMFVQKINTSKEGNNPD